MSDAADILSGAMTQARAATAAANESSVVDSLQGPPPPPPPSHHPSRAMRTTGMSREVLDLLKNSTEDRKSASLPPIVPTFPIRGKSPEPSGANKDAAEKGTIKVGNRWISKEKPAREWVWASFNSSARTDGALFRHWVRAHVEYPDYPYARFDIHLDHVVYTEREYRQYLQTSNWTKSETDLLMDLARKYELRWAVIYDGWIEANQSPARKVEDLQHRYYSVAALLTQSRVAKEAAAEVASLATLGPQASGDAEEESLVMETAAARAIATGEPNFQPLITTIGTGSTNKNMFDLSRERERRSHMELLWNRTKEEELEEAELRKELRLVEAQMRKLKKSGGHILAASAGGPSSQNPSRSVTPLPMLAAGRAAAAPMADSDLLDQCFASTAPTPMPQTPYLQSGRLVAPATGGPVGLNKTTLNRMDDVLAELKIVQRPLPTKRVCDLYDAVRKDALTLITLQKIVLQKEAQLQSKRVKLAKAGGNVRVVDEETLLGITPVTPSGAAAASTSGGSGRYKSGSGGKTKAVRSGSKSKGGATRSDGGAPDSKGGGKKGSSKRKKRSDGKSPSAATAMAAAGQAAAANAKRDDDDAKPNKKRARKN